MDKTNSILSNEYIFQLTQKILSDCKRENIEIRLFGSVALLFLDPTKLEWLSENRKLIADVDIVVLEPHVKSLERYFVEQKFNENVNIKMLFGNRRRSFYSHENISIDIFIQDIYLCQEIVLYNRFFLDYPTISIQDLFLSKIQKQKLSATDIFDIDYIMNYMENKDYIVDLCVNNWRWWKTLQTNIPVILNSDIDVKNEFALSELLELIDKKDKSIKWKLRDALGSGIQWYNNVES